ncbi:MAG: CYTH domain-containing protein [Clostridiales bacterium]|jgi:CYTH domain-containing protein|nr:CYTH domain-containing protein [Clostridiales bacterium]
MEIERKFLVNKIPENIDSYEPVDIVQGYIFFDPALRLRKQGDTYIITMKSSGGLVRQEYEMEISEHEFNRMWEKVEGHIIDKTRYKIPLENSLVCDLDVFHKNFDKLVTAEVEFESVKASAKFIPPCWFGREVTGNKSYANSAMAETGRIPEL